MAGSTNIGEFIFFRFVAGASAFMILGAIPVSGSQHSTNSRSLKIALHERNCASPHARRSRRTTRRFLHPWIRHSIMGRFRILFLDHCQPGCMATTTCYSDFLPSCWPPVPLLHAGESPLARPERTRRRSSSYPAQTTWRRHRARRCWRSRRILPDPEAVAHRQDSRKFLDAYPAKAIISKACPLRLRLDILHPVLGRSCHQQ